MNRAAMLLILSCLTLLLDFSTTKFGVGIEGFFPTHPFVLGVGQSLGLQAFDLRKRFAIRWRNPFYFLARKRDWFYPLELVCPVSCRRFAVTTTQNALSKLRRDFYLRHGILYGCPEDPTIMEVYKNNLPVLSLPVAVEKSLRNLTSFDQLGNEVEFGEPQTYDRALEDPSLSGSLLCQLAQKRYNGPPRVALLFLTRQEGFLHLEIWVAWLTEARKFSYYLYLKRQGPYRDLASWIPFTPLYSLHIHISQSKPTKNLSSQEYYQFFLLSLYNIVKRGTRLLMRFFRLTFVSKARDPRSSMAKNWWDVLNKTKGCVHRKAVLEEIRAAEIHPSVYCTWGNVNPCQYELLRHGLQDATVSGFIFISESTIPVKPFFYIYQEYLKNPTSRFHFSNLNLPLVRKHHQWIVLNRYHARLLVDYPEKWRCSAWLKHWYKKNIFLPAYAAPDEYLPFYALSEIVGFERIWNEINNKQITRDLYNFTNTFVEKDTSLQFQHTWVCWQFFEESLESQPCTRLGKFFFTLGSPVNYYHINANEAINSILSKPNVWFARKFHPDCLVSTDGTVMSLEAWLSHQLIQFYVNHPHLNVTSFF